MSYKIEPDNWNDCFSIEEWLKQWIDTTAEEDEVADFIFWNNRNGLFDYLEGKLIDEKEKNYWTGLSNKQKKVVWDCAIRCYEAQQNTLIAVGSKIMKSTNSIRW